MTYTEIFNNYIAHQNKHDDLELIGYLEYINCSDNFGIGILKKTFTYENTTFNSYELYSISLSTGEVHIVRSFSNEEKLYSAYKALIS